MPSEPHLVSRRIPLATPFGRQVGTRGGFGGPVLSVLIHVLIIGALVWNGYKAMEALAPGEGPGKGGGGGGGGNRAVTMLLPAAALAAPVPPPVTPPTDALVVPKQVEPLPPQDTMPPTPPAPTAAPAEAAASPGDGAGKGPGAGTGTGGGTGSGTGTGVGSGVGPDSGGGGGRVFPPQPQGILIPPAGAPSELRGVNLTVRFDISERGEVLGVEVTPAIRNSGYRNEFMRSMRRYTFTPGYTMDGRPVRSIVELTITVRGR